MIGARVSHRESPIPRDSVAQHGDWRSFRRGSTTSAGTARVQATGQHRLGILPVPGPFTSFIAVRTDVTDSSLVVFCQEFNTGREEGVVGRWNLSAVAN